MHGLTQYDKQVGTEIAWHGLTDIQDMIEFENSGLDWQVLQVPVFDEDMKELQELTLDKNGEEVYRPYLATMAGKLCLNIGKETYQTIQNKALWEAVKPLIDEYGFKVVSSGSVYGRKRVFLTLEGDASLFEVKKGDKLSMRLNVTSSHDGTIRAGFFNSTMRIVCHNTFMMSLRLLKAMMDEYSRQPIFFSFVKHTKNAETKLDNVKQGLITFYNAKEKLCQVLQAMDKTTIAQDDARALIAGTIAKGETLSTRSINQIDTIQGLFSKGLGNNGKSVYDVFNGITEYYTRHASDNVEKLVLSSEFGTYASVKENAFEKLSNLNEIDELVKQGEALLATV